jgi:hypothetical protein
LHDFLEAFCQEHLSVHFTVVGMDAVASLHFTSKCVLLKANAVELFVEVSQKLQWLSIIS